MNNMMGGAGKPGSSSGNNKVSQESMMQQATNIWTMLDEMATSNPESYRSFIDKQMTEGKRYMKPPEPHMCVHTNIQRSENKMLFINFFEWMKVPEPPSEEAPIPVMGSPMYHGQDQDGPHSLVAVAFNPKVLEDFGVNSKLVEERQMLVNLAIDYIEAQHKITISRSYTLLGKTDKCKGPVQSAIDGLTQKFDKDDEQFQEDFAEVEKTFGPGGGGGGKESLLHQLSNVSVTDHKTSNSQSDFRIGNHTTSNGHGHEQHHTTSNGQSEPTLNYGGSKPAKKSLIEEVGGSESGLPEPEYDVLVKEGDDGGTKKFVVKVKLPGVMSVGECDLDISESELNLEVSDQYQLTLPLQQKLDSGAAQARFSKKSSILTVTVPILDT